VAESGIEISQEAIDNEIQAAKDQAGSQENYEQQLATANLTEEQLRENIVRQLATREYVFQNVDVNSVTVSDEEIQKFYDDSKVAQPDLPPLDAIRDQAEQQLLTNKQQELINQFIATLRDEADVQTTPLE